MLKKLLLLLLVISLLASCTVPGIGVRTIRPGAVRTVNIMAPLPEDTGQPVEVVFRFSAARFELSGGASALAEGTVIYNVDEMAPRLREENGVTYIEQGELEAAIPPSGTRNEWTMRLNNNIPYHLRVQAGAYQGTWHLGGLRLRDLTITEGATRVTYDFSQPNPDAMENFNLTTGASDITLRNLLNANFARMDFNAGVGTYNLDFSGTLRRSASVRIRTGVSRVTVTVPDDLPVRVRVRGALRQTTIEGNFVQDGDDYMTPSWENATTRLDITIEMGLGQLTVRQPS